MRPIVIVLIVVALGIAGLTAAMIHRFLAVPPPGPSQVQKAVEPTAEEVLVAAADIAPGAVVKAEDVRYQLWPTTTADGGRLVRRGTADDPKSGFVGTVARRRLLAGEPLTPDAVFRQDESGVMAGLLSPGMRAVSVPVSATSGTAGFIMPNDRVDVLLNQDLTTIAAAGGNQPLSYDIARFSSEIVLSNVRVLAVDDKMVKPDSAATVSAKTVTLEVTPKDAELLVTALRMGEVTLALRSLAQGEGGEATTVGYTADIEVSRALQAAVGRLAARSQGSPRPLPKGGVEIRINRGGAISVQGFSN